MNKQILEDADNCGAIFDNLQDGEVTFNSHYDLNRFAELIKARAIAEIQSECYVLVPIEPTDEMIRELTHEWDSKGATSMYENYKAMIEFARLILQKATT